ncbi:leucine-rich repeat-containing protein 14-like [Cynocephalus volans]|uniref:leucine-rich repeat-containing protein 14-like n=1 Tax=Cynocephalus volans TaxID=110931 RepID=UPI002FCBE6CF
MDQKTPATLLELATKSLLSNEPAAIHALEELPRDTFVQFLTAAFLGGHKKVLKAMVRIWPFPCLHVGTLRVCESQYDNLEAMIDGLQILPAQISSFRYRQIDKMPVCECVLQFLDMGCIDHLEVDEIYLNEITTFLAQMTHLHRLSMSHIPFTSFMRRSFETFLNHLVQMDTLQEISLSYCHTHRLHKLLRCLPPQLDALYLSFCRLSNRDITVLSQSPAATHLRLLSLSNVEISWELSESFQTLLASVSGTLEYLQITSCLITDSTLTAVIPALSRCSHLCVFSFASNPITMRVLTSLLQHLTNLTELKRVIYPVPVHCYEQLHDLSSLNQQKLSEVQAQLKAMLQAVKRHDMLWTTSPE